MTEILNDKAAAAVNYLYYTSRSWKTINAHIKNEVSCADITCRMLVVATKTQKPNEKGRTKREDKWDMIHICNQKCVRKILDVIN